MFDARVSEHLHQVFTRSRHERCPLLIPTD
jgi:hypothetical protein